MFPKYSTTFIALGFVLILFIGTVGYAIIENYTVLDALYMTVITATTIGFGEVAPLSDAGKLFTILLSIFSVSLVFFFFGILTQSVFVALRSRSLLEVDSETLPVFLPAHEFFKPGKKDKLVIASLPAGHPFVGKTKLAVLTHYHILVMAVKDSSSSFTINVPMDYVLQSHHKMVLLAGRSKLKEFLIEQTK